MQDPALRFISDATSSAGELRAALAARFDVAMETVPVGGRAYELLKVRDTNALVDAIDPAAFAVDERLPYWAEVWASAVALAAWCCSDLRVAGANVLELGCGLGLPGLVAAHAGARLVTLSDYEDDALLFSRHNALRNAPPAGVPPVVEYLLLDWRAPALPRRYDVILGADIVYERSVFTPLLNVLRTGLAPGGVAVFAEPDRSVGGDFFRLAEQSGFSVQRSTVPVQRDGRMITVNHAELRPEGRR